MTRSNLTLTLGSILLFSLAAPTFADGSGWLSNTYVAANIGRASSGVSVDAVQARFNNSGITNTTINTVEDSRTGFGLGVGYEILPRWAVELAYFDLGQVDVDFTSSQAINNLEDVHPESGEGFTFSALYKQPIDSETHARVRLGLFNWKADYSTTQGNGSMDGTDSDSGTDLYWGGGIGHQMTEQLTLIVEVQRFKFERDDTTYINLGTEWRF